VKDHTRVIFVQRHLIPLVCVTSNLLHYNAHTISRTINKPYTCSLCQAWFTTHDSLKICKRAHTGEKAIHELYMFRGICFLQ